MITGAKIRFLIENGEWKIKPKIRVRKRFLIPLRFIRNDSVRLKGKGRNKGGSLPPALSKREGVCLAQSAALVSATPPRELPSFRLKGGISKV